MFGSAVSIDCVVYMTEKKKYCQISITRGTLEGNKIVDHSDVAGTLPVGAAPNTSSFLT